jgi:hypothetical protein
MDVLPARPPLALERVMDARVVTPTQLTELRGPKQASRPPF